MPPLSLKFLTLLAQWAGIAMPTLYAGIAYQYSLTLRQLQAIHTTQTPDNHDPRPLARQWLALYQQGPVFVRPLVLSGTLANIYLSLFNSTSQRLLYLLAATLTFSIVPITLLLFEPGINGACKWKVQRLLQDEGFRIPIRTVTPGRRTGWITITIPSPDRHSATDASKRWAEETGMGELVMQWVAWNHARWVVGLLAGGVSALAGCGDIDER